MSAVVVVRNGVGRRWRVVRMGRGRWYGVLSGGLVYIDDVNDE